MLKYRAPRLRRDAPCRSTSGLTTTVVAELADKAPVIIMKMKMLIVKRDEDSPKASKPVSRKLLDLGEPFRQSPFKLAPRIF